MFRNQIIWNREHLKRHNSNTTGEKEQRIARDSATPDHIRTSEFGYSCEYDHARFLRIDFDGAYRQAHKTPDLFRLFSFFRS